MMKKLFRNLIRKLYFKYVAKGEHSNCQVVEVEEDTDQLHIALGITQERLKELKNITEEEVNKSNNLFLVFNRISSRLNHPNELAFAMYALGCSMERSIYAKKRNIPDDLIDFFNNLGKDNDI